MRRDRIKCFSLLAAWLLATAAHAQLAVSVSPVKVTGSKAVVKLEMKNGFTEKIESARAVCFLADDQGKVVGHATQWVIGGTRERPAMEPGATNVFHLVIATDRATTTNLAARVTFSRVVLAGGKLADATKQVAVTPAAK